VAIQCNPQEQHIVPITRLDCRDFGLWCAEGDAGPACVDPDPQAAPTACSLVGKFADPNSVAYEFKDDGTYTIRNLPRGIYGFQNGLFQADDSSGLCMGSTSGYYSLEFNEDCSQFTLHTLHDGCRLRGESWDLTVLKRVP
jgi:hypothetical protein